MPKAQFMNFPITPLLDLQIHLDNILQSRSDLTANPLHLHKNAANAVYVNNGNLSSECKEAQRSTSSIFL